MIDLIDRQTAIDAINALEYPSSLVDVKRVIVELPSAQQDDRLNKIAELVDGTIYHFDREDAMDLLYQIKEVLK